jgi:hypothetical protein
MRLDIDSSDYMARKKSYIVGALVLGAICAFFYIAVASVRGLVNDLDSSLVKKVEGVITLAERKAVHWGDSVTFTTEIYDDLSTTARTYVTVACYQSKRLVYGTLGGSQDVYAMPDERAQKTTWKGGRAVCTASLVHQGVSEGESVPSVVDSVDFVVQQ